MWCCKYFGLATFWGLIRELEWQQPYVHQVGVQVFWSGNKCPRIATGRHELQFCSFVCTYYRVGQRHGSVECHFCAQVMIYWALSFIHNQLVQNCSICLLVTNLYLGPVYVWKTHLCTMIIITWPAIYILGYVWKIWYIISVKSSESVQCDAFYMNNSGFVKLFKLYLYLYLQYSFTDSLVVGQGMIHKIPWKWFRQHINCWENFKLSA